MIGGTLITGALVGAGTGFGIWLVWTALARRRIGLIERISPYLRDRTPGSRLLAPGGTTGGPLAPLMADLSRWLGRIGSTEDSVARRLIEAGRATDINQFRVEQLAWASGGGGLGLVVALALAARGGGLVAGLMLVLTGALAGALGADYLLSAAAKRRTARILQELPDLAELAALAVGAGESPAMALARVSATSRGELAAAFADIVTRTRTGVPFARALEDLAAQASSQELARFADAIVVATERGTPLAEVLRAQASDLRENARARLLEVGGTREQLMLAPVVFAILPVTVMFALFPGLTALEVGF